MLAVSNNGILTQSADSLTWAFGNNTIVFTEEFADTTYTVFATAPDAVVTIVSKATDEMVIDVSGATVGGFFIATGTPLSAVADSDTEHLVSLAKVKSYIGITNSDHDVLLTDWLSTVSKSIKAKLNQAIVPVEHTSYLDGTGSTILWLDFGRILSLVGDDEAERLASLQYRDSATASWTDLLTDEDYIYIDSISNWKVELLDGWTFPAGQKNIKIVYNAGFNPVPFDLQTVAKEMMQVMWDESKQGGDMLAKTSKSVGEGGINVSNSLKDMEKRWEAIFAKYKRWS